MPLSTSHIEDTFSSREEGIKRLLSSILNLNLQHESNEKHIISTINRLLSTAKHRKEGLEYLNVVIDNCSPSVIAENALNWTSHCIIRFPDDVLRELKLRVLGEIIKIAHSETEFNKKFVSDYISKLLDNCTTTSHINPYECEAALKTLTTSMQYYPSWFGAHRQKIENFLLIFLDSENAVLVKNAALAFHYLQQVGSAGPNGANHKLNFTQNFHKLCNTVHKLYDIFFESEKEIFQTDRPNDDNNFEFKDDPSCNTQALLHVNARRIRNVLKFIETMIKTKFPVVKETKPKELLEVITRGTSIHKCITSDNIESLETYQFSFLLSEIQCSVLKLLRLFIIWYQGNCLPFSYSISKILVDSLERSHNCECFKYDSLYQESSYRALSEWLSISKSSLHPQFQSQILACILKDVTPVKNQITLTISEAASGKKSQKAKRKVMTDRIISSGNQSLSNDSTTFHEKNNEKNTCKFALTALRHLLELAKLNVKPALLKDLYKSIFDSLTTIQCSKPFHPYSDALCQAKLYEVLVALYYQNTLSILPPLQTTLDILTRGVNDSNRFVSEICQRGLRDLEILCQPICPSLYLGVENEDEEIEEEEEVREAIEIEEMDADEDVAATSVDYDASTDEYSPNVSFMQNTRSTSVVFDVEEPHDVCFSNEDALTEECSLDNYDRQNSSPENVDHEVDTDFTVDDKITGKDADVKIGLEEVDANSLIEDENKEPDALHIIEDDEINQPGRSSSLSSLHEEEKEENKEDTVIEELKNQDKSEKENSAQKKVDAVLSEEAINIEKSDENEMKKVENNDFTREGPVSEQAGLITQNTTKDCEDQNSTIGKLEDIVNEHKGILAENSETKNEQVKEDPTGLQIDSTEPPAKKAKPNTEDEMDLGDVFDEQTDKKGEAKDEVEDPDSSYLEDDSFVDEVKDYY